MNDILNRKTKIDVKTMDQIPAGAVILKLISGSMDLPLKKAGDFIIEKAAEETTVTFYAGEKLNADSWRAAGGKMAGWLKSVTPETAWLDLAEITEKPARANLLEGILLGAFEFDRYKKENSGGKDAVLAVPSIFAALVEERRVVCEAVNMARDWAHEPASVINPETLSERIKLLAETYGLKCRVLEEQELVQMGAGAITAVGQGSKTPSRMIVLEYAGTKKTKPVVLVGKAITFDSGGYSIKPSDSMVGMKYDKCGAMAVLGVMRAAAELRYETPIVGVICAAENMLSEKSYRPDDILHTLSGLTVEVISTDAEGRLVLADGLTYAQQQFEPAALIDLATLTGGCVVAYGHVRAGVLSNNTDLFESLFESGEKTWERIWRLPHDDDYAELIKSPDADIKNSGGRWGSPVTGGIFLKQFVKDEVPWAHLDIAGVADSDKASAYSVPGATGFGVRLLLDWLKTR